MLSRITRDDDRTNVWIILEMILLELFGLGDGRIGASSIMRSSRLTECLNDVLLMGLLRFVQIF